MTKQRKKLLVLLLTTLLVFGASFGAFYATQQQNFYASMDGYITAKAGEDVHPYIKMSASNTAAWIYTDSAPTALNAADRTVKALNLPLSAQELLERIRVTREKKNVWITVEMEGENAAQLKDIISTFAQNLFEDVAAASGTNLPLASFSVLRPPEIENRFPYTAVLIKSAIATAVFALAFLAIAYGIPAYRKRNVRRWTDQKTEKQSAEENRSGYRMHLKQTLIRLPLQTFCVLLCAGLLIYGAVHLFFPKSYTAKQLIAVSLMEDEIQTTEMVMESQEFLLSYYAHLTHPMLMRLFHQTLPHTITDSYTERDLMEMCTVTHQEPTGIFVVTFTAKTPERAEQLCAAFTAYAFPYLCDFLALGESKTVGISPEVTQNSSATDEIASAVGGVAVTFGYLAVMDARMQKNSPAQKRYRKKIASETTP